MRKKIKFSSIILFSLWVFATFFLFLAVCNGFLIIGIEDKDYPEFSWWGMGDAILSR
jgi:hypothetical protein